MNVDVLVPNLKNVRRTHAQMLDEVRAIAVLLCSLPAGQRPKFEGRVPADRVVRLAEALMEAGCDEVGITTFDSSLGGLGGCPFAPGASGNIVTEDLVFMLEAMGLRTGIELPRLLEVRHVLREALPGEPLYGFTPDAGLPLGFQPAAATGATQ
jgi:hydroxymethylglutaryl-CoA lyase